MLIDNMRLPDYLRSTDFKTFEGLLKLLGGTIKKDVDGITDLKDYSKCAEHMLPLLANYLGCPYFDKTTTYANRLIIKNWWHMMRTKGTLPTLQLATSLALVAYDAAEGGDVDLFGRSIELIVDVVTGNLLIRVLYESENENDEEKRKELNEKQIEWIDEIIQYVKPAGFNTIYIPSQFLYAYLDVQEADNVRFYKFNYEPNFESGIGLSVKVDGDWTSPQTLNIKELIEEFLDDSEDEDFDLDHITCPNSCVFKDGKLYDIYTDTNGVQYIKEVLNDVDVNPVVGSGRVGYMQIVSEQNEEDEEDTPTPIETPIGNDIPSVQ